MAYHKLSYGQFSIKAYICFVMCLLYVVAVSQNETVNWYFGENAGLSFEHGIRTALNNGNMNTPAGCACISDKEGNLLFYTNGQTVWNKSHQIMENGMDLAGDIEHTQTSIIVPLPNSSTTFYIFTTRTYPSSSTSFISGVSYSIVEFTDEYPLGHITNKNVILTQNSTEKITAIYDPVNNVFRIISFAALSNSQDTPNNSFYIFTLGASGIETINFSYAQIATIDGIDVSKAGAIKISPNGEYIALSDYENDYIYLFSFVPSTSTIEYITFVNTSLLFYPIHPYGIEFSPDSSILYFSGFHPSESSPENFLYKYILGATLSDKILIESSTQYSFGTLQRAIDDKIYIANYQEPNSLTSMNALSVINDPDNIDNPDYQPLAITLGSGQSLKGLPNFVTSYFENRIIVKDDCTNETIHFTLDAYASITSAVWDFGDGTTSNLLDPDHVFYNPGTYNIKATITVNNQSIDVYKELEIYPLPQLQENATLEQCDADNDGTSYFNLFSLEDQITTPNEIFQLSFFYSYDDAENTTNAIDNPDVFQNTENPQELFVRIISEKGCVSISNFFIETTYTDIGNVIPLYVCEDSDDIINNDSGLFNLKLKKTAIRNQFNLPETYTITYYSSFEDAQTLSNPIDLDYISESTIVWVRIDNDSSGCSGIEPLELVVNSPIILDIQDQYIICDTSLQDPIILDGGINNDSWEWQNNNGTIISTSRFFNLNAEGYFSVTVFKNENGIECSLSKDFEVIQSGIPEFNEIIADNYEIYVSVTGNSSYEFSLDGINYYGEGLFYTFSNIQAGLYTIYVRDLEDCETPIQTNISLIAYPKYISPNGDSFNSLWKIHGISNEFYKSVSVSIYDRYGKNLYNMNLSQNNNYGWDGTYNGKILNSSDYWFKAVLIDHENNQYTKSGHFSIVH